MFGIEKEISRKREARKLSLEELLREIGKKEVSKHCRIIGVRKDNFELKQKVLNVSHCSNL